MMKFIDINEKLETLLARMNLYYKFRVLWSQCVFHTKIRCKIEVIETFNLCDIRRRKNPKMKRFTFRQQYCSGFIQTRLNYILISNALQEYILSEDVL